MCFITFVKPFWHTDFDYGLLRLPDLEIRLTAGVTSQPRMLTPPRHLIPPLVCSGVRVCPIFRICISYGIYETDHCSIYYPFIFSILWSLFTCWIVSLQPVSCETAFSQLELIKICWRTRLSGRTLNALLVLKPSEIGVHIFLSLLSCWSLSGLIQIS
jgi:hypothetical protein